MSFWYYEPQLPSNFRAAGGEAGLGEIADAARKQMELVENSNASYQALVEAYDKRIADIAAATGERVENPMRIAERLDREKMQAPRPMMYRQPLVPPEMMDGPPMPTNMQKEGQKFSDWLSDLAGRYPDQADKIRANVPIKQDAQAIARGSEEDMNRLSASRPGLGSLAAGFYGGFKGTLNDPLQVATMMIGAGPGAGRTLAARVASSFMKEALINGTIEAAQQPQVQAWREKIGLPSGFVEGVRNTLFAAALGGAFGAGGEVLAAGGRRLLTGKWLDDAATEVARTAPVSPDVKRALAGDGLRSAEVLAPIREALPPEARAAIDSIEADRAIGGLLPVDRPDLATRNLDQAVKVAISPDAERFSPDIDRARLERIVSQLLPNAPKKPKGDSGKSLQEFLIRAGGVQDQKGEISALGLQNASQKFAGKLVRTDGRPLDDARLVAAEAGYFDHLYGNPTEAMEKSTIADLLEELDRVQRQVTAGPDDGGRAYVEARVHELMTLVGPDVDEGLIAKAVQLAEAEGLDPISAFDQVAIAAERAGGEPAVDVPRFNDPSDDPFGGFEPDQYGPEDMLSAEDLTDIPPDMDIPFFDDDRPATIAQMLDDIDQTDFLFQVTEACKV